MEQRKVHIDNLYQEKQEQFAELPAFAWDNMEKSLDASKDRRRIYPWVWYVLLTALVLLICYFIFSRKTYTQHSRLDNPSSQSVAEQNNYTAPPKTKSPDHSEADDHKAEDRAAQSVEKKSNAEHEPVKPPANQETVTSHAASESHTNTPVEKTDAKKRATVANPGHTNNSQPATQQPLIATQTMPSPKNNSEHKLSPTTSTSSTAIKKNEDKEAQKPVVKKEIATANDQIAQSNKITDVTKVLTPQLSEQKAESTVQQKTKQTTPVTMDNKVEQKDIPLNTEQSSPVKTNESQLMPGADKTETTTATKPEPVDDLPSVMQNDPKRKKTSKRKKSNETTSTISTANPQPENPQDKPVKSSAPKDSPLVQNETTEPQGIPVTASSESAGQKEDVAKTEKPKRSFRLFEVGVKAGYEFGLQSNAINKFSAGPYIQYNLSERLSVAIQPAIRSGQAKSITLPASQAYYQQTGTTIDSQLNPAGGRLIWLLTYHHKYDSVVVSYQSKTQVTEFEVPVLLQYNLPNGLGFSAGVNFITGTLASVTEMRQDYKGLEQQDTFQREVNVISPPPDTSNSFHHTALPWSSYVPVGSTTVTNPLRIGCTLGVRYSRQRWLAELSLHQTISGLNDIRNTSLRQGYSQPYFRFVLGYRLIR